MNLYEFEICEMNTIKLRVRADSPKEAEAIYNEFKKTEPEWIAEEFELNGTKINWINSEFTEVHPSWCDELGTISKNEDGSFDAQYEGGDE